ncbi:MAG: hypothetical protein CMJ79_15775 [Planctomycetaceae bacterium]|nr:hypothetical protein [Planctomycetaceae bacterium]
MSGIRDILSFPKVYQLWQAPFAHRKFTPLLKHNDLSNIQRVLDVGCGPGTNARFFRKRDYLGLDINPRYIESASRRFSSKHGAPCEFRVQDVCQYHPPDNERADFVLLNSFLHHIDDENSSAILSRLHDVLAEEGHVHILDLVLPDSMSISRLLAKLDRGNYPRPLEHWKKLFTQHFTPVIFEPFDLTRIGIPFWKMVYFKGKKQQ